MKKRSATRGAFTMIELIGTLVLLAAFALISTRLFGVTMKLLNDAPTTQDGIARFESVTQALRQDAWGAQAFIAVGKDALEMEMPGREKVSWRIDPSGDIDRTDGSDRRVWAGAGVDAVLEVDGLCVVLRSTSGTVDRGEEIRFLSLLQLANMNGKTK